jgi:glycosyltransferase involved in cell wall biosynthesis
VYNGERYLAEALDSILSQTFTDFELIISDNASTDNTEKICKEYAAKDPRIHYYRNPTNIGGANNENHTFRLARGKYFRWAADDDVCAPELFAKCVSVLDQDRSIVVCHSIVIEIDAQGNYIRTTSRKKAESEKPHARFLDLIFRDHYCEATYGVIRADVLRKTRLQQNYTDSDRTLLAELSLYGKFHEIPEPLFYKRYHPGNEYIDWRARMAWFNPTLKGKIVFPNWVQFFDYLVTINRAPLSWPEKARCYAVMFRWLQRHGRYMAGDLKAAAYMSVRSREWRERNASNYNWE